MVGVSPAHGMNRIVEILFVIYWVAVVALVIGTEGMPLLSEGVDLSLGVFGHAVLLGLALVAADVAAGRFDGSGVERCCVVRELGHSLGVGR